MFQNRSHPAVMDPTRWLCIWRRYMNKALLFAHALIRFQPPSVFPRWRMERATLNISPRQINQDIVALICRIQPGGGGNIRVTYQIFSRGYSCTNWILLSILRSLKYVSWVVARTCAMTEDQAAMAVEFTISVNWKPNILMSLWYGMFLMCLVVYHVSRASTRDFCMLILAPVVALYASNVSFIFCMSATEVRKW